MLVRFRSGGGTRLAPIRAGDDTIPIMTTRPSLPRMAILGHLQIGPRASDRMLAPRLVINNITSDSDYIHVHIHTMCVTLGWCFNLFVKHV